MSKLKDQIEEISKELESIVGEISDLYTTRLCNLGDKLVCIEDNLNEVIDNLNNLDVEGK